MPAASPEEREDGRTRLYALARVFLSIAARLEREAEAAGSSEEDGRPIIRA